MDPMTASTATGAIPAVVTPMSTATVTITAAQLPSTTGSPSVPTSITQPNININDHIKSLSQKINLLGPGPHTPKQKDDLTKLRNQLVKAHKLAQEAQMQGVKAEITPGMLPSVPVSSRTSGAHVGAAHGGETKVLDKRRLTELVREVDALEQLDDDVEEVLMQIADDFIDSVVNASCQIAKHRKANTVEVKDVQLHLERNWNMWIPGFGSEDLRPYKKAATTEAHKQRMALIKKTLKKY